MSILSFEHREIDYGSPSNMEACDLGQRSIEGVEFRAYRCTRDGRLSTRAKHALVVCMSCGRSLYEFEHFMMAWYMNSEVAWHHQSCDGSTSKLTTLPGSDS